MSNLESLEKKLKISFKDKDLLRLAFIHSSYVNENPGELSESNERLEFLGDALLDLVVAHELYERYPERHEGELTALRSALVRGESLARVARSLDLGDYLTMGVGEEASGGRKRQSNLAALYEALVGAYFQDQGYEAARDFSLRTLESEIANVDKPHALKNPKSALQELIQGKKMPAPSYRTIDIAGQDHNRTFTAEVLIDGEVMGKGTGRRKSLAEQEAAQEALNKLQEG